MTHPAFEELVKDAAEIIRDGIREGALSYEIANAVLAEVYKTLQVVTPEQQTIFGHPIVYVAQSLWTAMLNASAINPEESDGDGGF
ncbi:MAG: hypothetical protein KGL39_05230 [Patescibacteria group bacterium]|nr:hypothetical protein [Patescibacteria group bacterium]